MLHVVTSRLIFLINPERLRPGPISTNSSAPSAIRRSIVCCQRTEEEIAAEIAQDCVNVLQKLQAASCDAVGFGRIQIRRYPDIPAWERSGWAAQYESRPVRVSAEIKILQ